MLHYSLEKPSELLDLFMLMAFYIKIIVSSKDSRVDHRTTACVEEYPDVKLWSRSADYQRLWNERAEIGVLLRTESQCSELIETITSEKINSIKEKAKGISTSPNCSTSSSSCLNDPIASNNTATATMTMNTTNNSNDNISDTPWLFGKHNISDIFKTYQKVAQGLIDKYETLPIESHICELASLTNVMMLNKDQHSPIAANVFSMDLLNNLTAELTSESMNYKIEFNDKHFTDLASTVTKLSMSLETRHEVLMNPINMSIKMEYGPKRLVRGTVNFIQKLPTTPLKDNADITETELWNTYYDPMLSCLLCDPDKLVHLRWINAIPIEGGQDRPDALIAKKEQLEYKVNIGHGEIKISQGNASKYLLCMDTLRLAVFNKNAIDINKLDASLAFQIHGFNIIFFYFPIDYQ